MQLGRRTAGILFLLAIGMSGFATLPGGGGAVRADDPATIIREAPPNKTRSIAAEAVEETAPPAFLLIPSIGVNAIVEQAGLTSERRMENPTTWDNVAWYRYGPSPGEDGSAVLAGHLDSDTGTAVFWDLHRLRPGDEVKIIDTRGRVHVFAVTGSETYPAAEVPMEELFAMDGEPRIALVTCDGSWNESTGYDERTVVFAVLAD